jgi:hypothetical protein
MKFLKTLAFAVPPAITGLVRVSVAIETSWEVPNFYANNRGKDRQGGVERRVIGILHVFRLK